MHDLAAQGSERVKAYVAVEPMNSESPVACETSSALRRELLDFHDAVRAIPWEELPDVEQDAITGPETVGDEVSHASRDLCGTVEM